MIKDSKMNQSLCLFQILQVETVSRPEPKSNQNSAESSTILDNEMSEMDSRTTEKDKSSHSIDKNVSSNTPILQVKLSSDQRQVSEPTSANAEIITTENIQRNDYQNRKTIQYYA